MLAPAMTPTGVPLPPLARSLPKSEAPPKPKGMKGWKFSVLT
jgi:hypothetical protein